MIEALGYVGARADGVDDWSTYATDFLGMQRVDKSRTTRAFRMDDRKQRLIVDGAGGQGIAFFGWEVKDAAALDAVAARLEAAGTKVARGARALADERHVKDLVVLNDPAGYRLEIFHGAECASDPFQPGRNISGFRTGPLGMGHVVLHMKSIQDVMPFYRDVLDFKLSDYFTRPFQCFFFHVNPRHHSIAFAEVGRDAVHHMMVELYSLDDMGQGYDIAQMDPDKIAVTLGRHAGDYVTSFYTHNPSGFQTEYGWGAQSIDDATWTPFERTCGPSFWGHDRYWLPPDKQQEARELRMQAARDGVRKPVQVIEGNYTLNPGVCPWWDAVTQKQKSA